MIIEQARVEDAGEILTLQKIAYRSEAEIYGDFSIPPLMQTLQEMVKDFKNQRILKAVSGEEIIGSVRGYIKERTCYIGRLIVHPHYQNRGIGTSLMNQIERGFEEAERFEIFTGHQSKRNLYLYQKLGYQPFRTMQASEKLTIVYLEKKSPGSKNK